MKRFSSLLAIAFSALVLNATETAYLRITLNALTNPARSTSEIRLFEDTDFSDAFDKGYDATCYETQITSYSTVFYALLGNQHLSSTATSDLNNLPLIFKANRVDTIYTMTFSNAEGRTLRLYDVVTDSLIPIVQSESYVFTIPDEQINTTVSGRFRITDSIPPCHAVVTQKVDSVLAGKTYLFHCRRLTVPDTYTDTLVNAAGCDSIVRLVLSTYSLPEPPASYRLCYTAGNFIIDNPDAAATAYILDSIGAPLSNHAVSAASQTSFTPTGLTTGNLYQVVGLHADTLFFRAR